MILHKFLNKSLEQSILGSNLLPNDVYAVDENSFSIPMPQGQVVSLNRTPSAVRPNVSHVIHHGTTHSDREICATHTTSLSPQLALAGCGDDRESRLYRPRRKTLFRKWERVSAKVVGLDYLEMKVNEFGQKIRYTILFFFYSRKFQNCIMSKVGDLFSILHTAATENHEIWRQGRKSFNGCSAFFMGHKTPFFS